MIGFGIALEGLKPDLYRPVKRTNHPLEPVFAGMLRRCYNPKEPLYHRYGGRGITVCDRWRVGNGIGFSNFVNDMGERPTGTSLDRIDNDGNYEAANCQWADRLTQNRKRNISRYVVLNGERVFLHELAKKNGLDRRTIDARIKRGIPVEDALSKDDRHDNAYHRARKANKENA